MPVTESDLACLVTSNEAAQLTGYHPSYLRQLARKGRLPARRVGRDWLVNKEALLQHKTRMDALGTDKHSPWREDLTAQGRGRLTPPERRGRPTRQCPVFGDVWLHCPLLLDLGQWADEEGEP